jgi:uncharacterized protein YwqG
MPLTPQRKYITSGTKVSLKLTVAERKLTGYQRDATEGKGTLPMQIPVKVSTDESVPTPDRVAAVRQKLREEFEIAGLGRVAGDLEKLMMASIRLKATPAAESDLKPGSSKLGGTPDLPEGVSWPQCNGVPMALLAQLRLQDLAPYDIDGQLPKSGILYFFYEAREHVWGYDPKHRGNWAVIYHDGDLDNPRPTDSPAELAQECRFRACTVTFSSEITLPSYDSRAVERLEFVAAEQDVYFRLPEADRAEGGVMHRMLGHPDQIQGDMTLECQLASHGIYLGNSEGYADPRRASLEDGADEWQLLLQIDSDEENLGAMWGDCGRVYFWIRQADLRKRDFGNVWLILQCC